MGQVEITLCLITEHRWDTYQCRQDCLQEHSQESQRKVYQVTDIRTNSTVGAKMHAVALRGNAKHASCACASQAVKMHTVCERHLACSFASLTDLG